MFGSAISSSPETYIRSLLPPLFAFLQPLDIYVFLFYKPNPIYVVVDSKLPVFNKQLIFGQAVEVNDQKEYWSVMAEKAYAKMLGSYQALISGNIEEALRDLTGSIVETISTKNQESTHKLYNEKVIRLSILAKSKV